ncbi:MAG: ABC transporter substrate-binding protein [Clostridiales Family XIII bacterium]|jgi:peptide/nickel transport system substrate-binding protein|nr:ABC transporter substrate-binding protein [Clostridiales Family XIII bacterium]
MKGNTGKDRGRGRRRAAAGASALLCALIAALLGACGTSVRVMLGGAEDAGGVRTASSVVYLPMESVRTLNPVLTKDEDSYYIGKLIYDSLFEPDADLSMMPSLAESYSYDESGLSVNIRLKSGLFWSDGEGLDAADAVFSIEAYAADPNAHLYGENVRSIKSAKTVAGDPLSFVISFKDAKNTSVALLTFPILPSHLYRSRSDLRKNAEDFIPVGSGPYAVREFDRYSHLTLVGNPHFAGGDVPQNTLEFQIVKSKSDTLNMLGINAISYAVSKEGDRATIYRDANIRMQPFPSNEAVWIGFNFNKELLARKEVRQAIAFAVDSEELLEVCFFSSGVPSDSVYYPGFLGMGEGADLYAADPDKSKLLLALAGLSDADGDGFYDYFSIEEGEEESAPHTLSLKLLVSGEDASRVSAAQMIRSSLERIGLVCELAVLDREAYAAALAAGDYDLWLGGGRLAGHFDLRPLLHSDYGNPIAYGDPALDASLDAFSAAKSEAERRSAFAEIRARLVEEIPYYCLFYKTYGAAAAPVLEGDMDPRFDDLYRGCENWRCVYETPPQSGSRD